jgi:hypothetical protein
VWGALIALELACAAPATAGKHEAPDVQGVVSEFRQICSELEQARAGLGAGALSDDEFADRVLDLFVRADSLQHELPRGGWIRSAANGPGGIAMARALRYLIESLRENYVGIASKNGIDFVEADRAYQAAVAWRPDFEATTATAAR